MIRVRCPICEQVLPGQSHAEWLYHPFCSARCRLIDLKRWLDEENGLPTSYSEAVSETGDFDDPP